MVFNMLEEHLISKTMEGLLIAGRVISMVDGAFEPTAILETLTEKGTHPLKRLPVDDTNPHCYIGGGGWNVRAGVEVYMRMRPRLVAFAYGNTRTEDFQRANAPYEGPVMRELFRKLIKTKGQFNPQTRVWTKPSDTLCNSRREIRQFMELARAEGMWNVGIVTVMVHMPRIQMFVAEFQQEEQFANMEVQYFISETVLIAADWKFYAPQVAMELRSKAFARNFARELEGMTKMAAGEYAEAKPALA